MSSTGTKAKGSAGGSRTPARKKPSRSRGPLVAGVSVGVVVLVVAAFIIVKLTSSPTKAAAEQLAPADVVSAVVNAPTSELAQIGTSAITATSYPEKVSGMPELLDHGLPELFYYGSEWCPFCAAQRWAMVNALSRFGTFSHLGIVKSSSSDVYPNTNTFSFYGSTYTSRYIAFVPDEVQDTNRKTLQLPTKAELGLLNHLDVAPVVPNSSAGNYSFPFLDIANSYVQGGSSFNPGDLQGLTWQTIAGSISDPSSTPAKDISGAANVLAGAICELTHNQPSSVCNTPVEQAVEAKLNAEKPVAAVGT